MQGMKRLSASLILVKKQKATFIDRATLVCYTGVNPTLQPGGAAEQTHSQSARAARWLTHTGLCPAKQTTLSYCSKHFLPRNAARIRCCRDVLQKGSQCSPVQCINISIRKINVVFLLMLQLVKRYCWERRELPSKDDLRAARESGITDNSAAQTVWEGTRGSLGLSVSPSCVTAPVTAPQLSAPYRPPAN